MMPASTTHPTTRRRWALEFRCMCARAAKPTAAIQRGTVKNGFRKPAQRCMATKRQQPDNRTYAVRSCASVAAGVRKRARSPTMPAVQRKPAAAAGACIRKADAKATAPSAHGLQSTPRIAPAAKDSETPPNCATLSIGRSVVVADATAPAIASAVSSCSTDICVAVMCEHAERQRYAQSEAAATRHKAAIGPKRNQVRAAAGSDRAAASPPHPHERYGSSHLQRAA